MSVSVCTCAFLDIGGARWFLDVEVPYANKHIHQFFLHMYEERMTKKELNVQFGVCISMLTIQSHSTARPSEEQR